MQPESAIISPASWTQILPLDDIFDSGGQDRPLDVDAGCGKGRFLLARAKASPGRNFLGIERLLRRVRRVDREIVRHDISNVRLLHIEASYAIEHLLPALSVTNFYILFPAPWPKKKHHKRRLITTSFVSSLHRTLQAGGQAHLATDHLNYFEEIYNLFREDPRFREIPALQLSEEERTNFELACLELKTQVTRCSFRKK